MSFYLIDKTPKRTSKNIVDRLKRKVKVKKAGHSGTLDPFATGLLIIATNEDTKFLDRFLNMKKTYSGQIQFGIESDTLDVDGVKKVIDKTIKIDIERLSSVIGKNFIGKITQVPPMYSAIKINGRRSYELAREGKEVKHKPVERIIYSFDVTKSKRHNKINFNITVSSGTYIRAIARDLAKKINTVAIVKNLRREKIDVFSASSATKVHKKNIKEYSLKQMLNIKEVKINKDEMKLVLEGKTFNYKNTDDLKEMIVINKDAKVLMKNIGFNKFFIDKRIK